MTPQVSEREHDALDQPLLERGARLDGAAELLEEPMHLPQQHRLDQAIALREVAVDRDPRHPQPPGHVVDREPP